MPRRTARFTASGGRTATCTQTVRSGRAGTSPPASESPPPCSPRALVSTFFPTFSLHTHHRVMCQVAECHTDSTTTTTEAPPAPPVQTAQIVGGVLGSMAVVASGVIALICWRRRARYGQLRSEQEEEEEEVPMQDMSSTPRCRRCWSWRRRAGSEQQEEEEAAPAYGPDPPIYRPPQTDA